MGEGKEKRRLILRNHQLLGDSLQMTPAVRDLKKANPSWEIKVETNHQHIWDNNPHITQFEGNGEVFNIGPKIVTQSSKTSGLHFTMGFRMSLEDQLKIKIPQGLLKPELFLNDYEKNRKIIDGKYWVINIDCGPYAAKKWINERWQEVINHFNWMTFVQVGLPKDNTYKLQGKNVIDYIGKTQDIDTGLRDLFVLVYHSEGCLSLVSSLMHIAAAFEKPCVIPAGAREPVTFEGYQFHRYLHKTGCLPCAKTMACWACSRAGCFKKWLPKQNKATQIKELGEVVFKQYKGKKKKDEKKFNLSKWSDDNRNKNWVPQCMSMIKTQDVISAINSYYEVGILKAPENSIKPVSIPVEVKPEKKVESVAKVVTRPLMKIVSNGKMLGGAERSVIEITKMAQERNYDVEIATRGGILCGAMKSRLSNVRLTNKITAPCDVLVLYSSDMIWDFHKPEFEIFNKVQAKRKVMALTYHLGQAGKAEWTKNWDLYLFLSSTLKDKFLERCPEANTKVLAPPVDLTELYTIQPDYKSIHIVRHSSQGDSKYPRDISDIVKRFTHRFSFMPSPSFMPGFPHVIKYRENQISVKDFLASGSCYWYLLPTSYTDQGPRVIMEAMAAGLPIIAENRDGAKDRVSPETGWLINSHDEVIDIFNSLTPDILKTKGSAARERAKKEFRKENWIEEILK